MGDEYERRARIYPALLAALPISATALILGITGTEWWSGVAGLVVASGFWGLIRQIGRHPGKKMEPGLWKAWGGPPTTILLRHRGDTNPVRVSQLHDRLETITGLRMPTEAQETEDPAGADDIYGAAVDQLREITRDQTRFALIFKENCNYGFRRNVLGLKPWAIAACVVAGIIAGLVAWTGQPEFLDVNGGLAVTLGVLDLVGGLAWWKLVAADWVKQPAFAYAERLLEATADLSG